MSSQSDELRKAIEKLRDAASERMQRGIDSTHASGQFMAYNEVLALLTAPRAVEPVFPLPAERLNTQPALQSCGPSQPETEGEARRQPEDLNSPSVQARWPDGSKYTGPDKPPAHRADSPKPMSAASPSGKIREIYLRTIEDVLANLKPGTDEDTVFLRDAAAAHIREIVRLTDALHNEEISPLDGDDEDLAASPAGVSGLDCKEFYDLMQYYRHAPVTDQEFVSKQFQAVIAYAEAYTRERVEQERERCAKIAESKVGCHSFPSQACQEIAAAIRFAGVKHANA